MPIDANESEIEDMLLTFQGVEGTIAGRRFKFEQGPKNKAQHALPMMPSGVEGILAPILIEDQRYALKLFRKPSAERRRRMQFLTKLQLHEYHHAFDAAPRGVVKGQLTIPGSSDPVGVEGYLAKFIAAETLDTLVEEENWDKYSSEVRLSFAAQLCMAVQILEAANLVHGDLQPRNILLSKEVPKHSELRLIDFDGFFHPDKLTLPPIPAESIPTRGCDGYRHRHYLGNPDSKIITSDRLALAVLVYSIVGLRSRHAELRGSATLLPLFDQEELNLGEAPTFAELSEEWPDGWALLCQAITANSAEAGPSPEQWLNAIEQYGVTKPKNVSTSGALRRRATLYIEDPKDRGSVKQAKVEVGDQPISLGAACLELSWLQCTPLAQGRLKFAGTVPNLANAKPIVFHFRKIGGEEESDVSRTPYFEVEAVVGERISWNFFEIKIA